MSGNPPEAQAYLTSRVTTFCSTPFEPTRSPRYGTHPVLSSESDKRDLQTVTCFCKTEHDRYAPALATMAHPPPWQALVQECPGVRGLQNVAQKRFDLIETACSRARIPGDVGDMAREFPQVLPDERVLLDPDHACEEGASV